MEFNFKVLDKEKKYLLNIISGRFIFKHFVWVPNIIAFIISLLINKSFWWALVHYFIGFWYLIVKLIFFKDTFKELSNISNHYF